MEIVMTADEREVVKELREKLIRAIGGAVQHGMGAFADSLMQNLRIVSYRGQRTSVATSSLQRNKHKARMVLSFPVTQDLCNGFDTLHGGAQATAVDIFTSLLLGQVHPFPSVTTDLHVSCIAPAPVGSTILCVCTVERVGGKLQFASCELYRANNGSKVGEDVQSLVLVAKGLHTKYVLKERKRGFVEGSKNNESTTTKQTKVLPRSKL